MSDVEHAFQAVVAVALVVGVLGVMFGRRGAIVWLCVAVWGCVPWMGSAAGVAVVGAVAVLMTATAWANRARGDDDE